MPRLLATDVQLELRTAGAADLAGLMALMQRHSTKVPVMTKSELEKWMQDPSHSIVVAYYQNKLVAFIMLRRNQGIMRVMWYGTSKEHCPGKTIPYFAYLVEFGSNQRQELTSWYDCTAIEILLKSSNQKGSKYLTQTLGFAEEETVDPELNLFRYTYT